MQTRLNPLGSLALGALLVAACGGDSKPADAKKDEVKADAKADAKPAMDDALAKRKADREAKEKAAKDAEANKLKLVQDLATLPAKLPKKLDKACDEVAAAQDAFMQKWFPDQATQWASGKGTQLALTKKTCISGGSIEVAACQAKALTDAPEELRKEIPALFTACITKFGKPPTP